MNVKNVKDESVNTIKKKIHLIYNDIMYRFNNI